MEPSKIAYEKAKEFDESVEELEANAGCIDYYVQGWQTAIETLKTELDSKFEKYGMKTAKDLLAEVTFKLGVS